MKHKAHIHNKQPRIYITRNPTFPTQKNQRNFSTTTSRVRASLNRSHDRCQVPDAQEEKSADCTIIRWPRPPDCCCRHNSLILLLPSQQPRRYPKWNGHDTAGRSPHSSTSSQSNHSRFQNHGTPFTRDKTPLPSAIPRFHERMSSRPSYVLHTRRRRAHTLTTITRLPAGQHTRRWQAQPRRLTEVKVTWPARERPARVSSGEAWRNATMSRQKLSVLYGNSST